MLTPLLPGYFAFPLSQTDRLTALHPTHPCGQSPVVPLTTTEGAVPIDELFPEDVVQALQEGQRAQCVRVSDPHSARHCLDEAHEALQLRCNVICKKCTGTTGTMFQEPSRWGKSITGSVSTTIPDLLHTRISKPRAHLCRGSL